MKYRVLYQQSFIYLFQHKPLKQIPFIKISLLPQTCFMCLHRTLKFPSSGSFHRATPPALSGFPGQVTPDSASHFHFQQAGSLSHAKHLISVTILTSWLRSQCYKPVQGKGIFPCSHGVLSSVIAEINCDMRVRRHYHELSI